MTAGGRRPSPGTSSTKRSRDWRPPSQQASLAGANSPNAWRTSRARAETMADIAAAIAAERGDDTGAEMLFWIEATRRSIESHRRDAGQSAASVDALAVPARALETTARAMALAMGYGFLLDPDRNLLSIGYRVQDGALDPSCYDLLASEARLASFIAIAKGDVPARHWFHLGRAVTPIAQWRRADLLVGVDVRIPDAVAGHARAGGKPARANQSTHRAAADRLWRRARAALGRF